MKDIILKKIEGYLPAVISGGAVVLAFPLVDLNYLAWVAFIPLLLSLWGKEGKEAFAEGYVFGMVYFFGTLYWIYHSIDYYGGIPFAASIALVLLLCGYLSLYPALFSFLFSRMITRTKLPGLLVAPLLWVVLEFARSYALTGFPWSSIGYSQYRVLPVIQIADITGIYGISFLVLAVNAAFADILLLKKRIGRMPLFPVSYTVAGLVSLLVVFALTLGYGFWRIGQDRNGRLITVSVVQGNIEQDKKWDSIYQNEVLQTYFTLSKKAAESSPQLVVWPETAVPFYFGSDGKNTERLVDFQKELHTDLLFGSVLVKERSADKVLLSNGAVLLDGEGNTAYEYDKIHLVPFGEYVPLRKILFFVDRLTAGIGDYISGRQYQTAHTGFGNFATLICYEVVFPGQVRKFFKDGGDFIVNITNDAWFGKTSGPFQHFSMAVFRAVENRKPLVRAANTGISGFIDSNGRVLSKTPLFEGTVLTGGVKTDGTVTFYTKYGDLFSYLCIVLSLVFTLNIKLWR